MGSCHTERSPETVLYGGRQSGGFVNRAVNRSLELRFYPRGSCRFYGSQKCDMVEYLYL